jgi:hypothetical protein
MKASQTRILQSFRRVQGFLDANTTGLTTATFHTQRTLLDDIVTKLTGHAIEQDASVIDHRGGTQNLAALRTALLENHMRPIAQIARALLSNVETISVLRMPVRFVSTEQLVTAAAAMKQAAAPFAEVFIEHGRPQDFIERLGAAAVAVRQVVDDRFRAQGRRVGATVGVVSELTRGRRAVQLIDAVIRPVVRNDPQLFAEWKNAKRVTLKVGAISGTSDSGAAGVAEPAEPKAA